MTSRLAVLTIKRAKEIIEGVNEKRRRPEEVPMPTQRSKESAENEKTRGMGAKVNSSIYGKRIREREREKEGDREREKERDTGSSLASEKERAVRERERCTERGWGRARISLNQLMEQTEMECNSALRFFLITFQMFPVR